MTLALFDREFIEGGIRFHQSVGRSLVFVSVSEPLQARPYRDSGAALTMFLRDLNRAALGGRVKAGLPWCAVGEWGEKSRRFHWHITIAGLAYPWCKHNARLFPAGLSSGDVVEVLGASGVVVSKEGTLKPLVQKHGFGGGFIGMRQVGFTSGDVGNVSNYLSKYLSKGDAGEDLPKGFQLVRASRGASAWWPGESLLSVRAKRKAEAKERARVRASAPATALGLDRARTQPPTLAPA